MQTIDLLDNLIYPSLDRADVFQELEPVSKGSYYLLTCPKCGKKEATVYKKGFKVFCNRKNQCGYEATLWDFVQEKKGLTNQGTLKELARLAKVTLPELGTADPKAIIQRQKKHDAFESFFELCGEALKNSQPAQAYLAKRGFTLEEAQALGIGFYPSVKTVKENIANIESIAGIASPAWENRIVGLWRTRSGNPLTIWGRTIADAEPKYLYLAGEPKESPFGLDTVRKLELIAVEGILDALSLRKTGFPDVIALGGSNCPDSHVDALKRARIGAITLNLDNDGAGIEGMTRAIGKLEGAGIRTYVIDPPLMGVKDPDEYIRKNGIDAYKTLLGKASSGGEWRIKKIIEANDISTTKGKHEAFYAGVEFLNGLQDGLAFSDCIKTLSQALDMPPDIIAEQCEKTKETQEREAIRRERLRLLSETQTKLSDGEAEAVERLEEGLKDLRLKELKIKEPSPLSLSDYLAEKHEREKTRDPNKRLGFPLTKFSELEGNIDGIQAGFYIIGAETNVGKTAFLTNLFLDILKTNKDARGIYFSLDDNKDIIITRFVGIETGLPLNQIQRRQENPRDAEKIAEAYGTLKDLSNAGRLILKDISEVNHIDALELVIRENAGDGLFVFIDGLYNLDIGGDYGGLREENIDRANRIKELVDAYKIPIITTGEIRKDDNTRDTKKARKPTVNDLMETGKFAYNANLVLLLFLSNEEKARLEELAFIQQSPEEIEVMTHYAKNKLSHFKGFGKLKFKTSTGAIREYDDSDA
jgi:DNA primase